MGRWTAREEADSIGREAASKVRGPARVGGGGWQWGEAAGVGRAHGGTGAGRMGKYRREGSAGGGQVDCTEGVTDATTK